MPERTAVVRRVAELVEGRGDVAVVGRPCPWRDDLVAVLGEWLPGVVVEAYDAVPGAVSAVVQLEVTPQEAEFRVLERDWEQSGRKARGEPLVPGARWVAADGDEPDEPVSRPTAPPGVDVVFVPVSGVRPPRRIRLFWDWTDHALWDDDYAYLGELEDLLPLSPSLRQRLKDLVATGDAQADWDLGDGGRPRWADEERALVSALAEELGPEFVVTT